jgi:hypothetical protein
MLVALTDAAASGWILSHRSWEEPALLQPAGRRRRYARQSGDLAHTFTGGQFLLGHLHLRFRDRRPSKPD